MIPLYCVAENRHGRVDRATFLPHRDGHSLPPACVVCDRVSSSSAGEKLPLAYSVSNPAAVSFNRAEVVEASAPLWSSTFTILLYAITSPPRVGFLFGTAPRFASPPPPCPLSRVCPTLTREAYSPHFIKTPQFCVY